jgi:hypothetical protein
MRKILMVGAVVAVLACVEVAGAQEATERRTPRVNLDGAYPAGTTTTDFGGTVESYQVRLGSIQLPGGDGAASGDGAAAGDGGSAGATGGGNGDSGDGCGPN